MLTIWPLQGVEGVEQPDREGRAGPHAAARRQVPVVVDLHAPLDVQVAQHLAHGRVAISSIVWQYSIFE